MHKIKIFLIFIGCLFLFLIYKNTSVLANEVVINKYPTAGDIVYGAPLFESSLSGGEASVEGTFSWKNPVKVYDAGEYSEMVVFKPKDNSYNEKEIIVKFKVNKRRVFLKFEDEIYKQYDSTNRIDLPNYIVGGIVDKTVYIRGKLEAELDGIFVGENKVILSGIELVGDKKDNYYLDLGGITTSVHPSVIEMLGDEKNRVILDKTYYAPIYTSLHVDKKDNSLFEIDNHDILETYDIYLKSEGNVLNVDKSVEVKVKLQEINLSKKGVKLYNYYKGEYQRIDDYKYENGYVIYRADTLGILIIAKEESFKLGWFIPVIIFVCLLIIFMVFIIFNKFNNKEKYNKYKSLKRGKLNED